MKLRLDTPLKKLDSRSNIFVCISSQGITIKIELWLNLLMYFVNIAGTNFTKGVVNGV